MATIQTIDPARRLVDLALNSTALPLPISLIPPALPQDIVISGEALREAPAPHQDSAGEPLAGLLQSASTPDASIADEAVLNSVNAALDAVRVSLQDTAPTAQVVDTHPGDVADLAPLSLVSPLDTLLTASVVSNAPDASAEAAPADIASVASDTCIVVPETAMQVLPQADALLGTAAQIIVDLTEVVGDVVEGVVHTADAVVGNVLVPTLNGLGLDILNGLVPAPPQTASAHDVSTASHDAAVFDVIGTETGIADHDVAYAPHAPQHLVGSGLI